MRTTQFLEAVKEKIIKSVGDFRLTTVDSGEKETPKELRYYAISSIYDEINVRNLPAFSLNWQDRTYDDNYRQRHFPYGLMQVRFYEARNATNLDEVRDYLIDCADLVRNGLSKLWKQGLGIIQFEQITSFSGEMPNQKNVAYRQADYQIILT